MKPFYLPMVLFAVTAMAQSVQGKLNLGPRAHDRDFIVRNTKVVLLTKTSRDTVGVNDRLEFSFPNAGAGTAFLYLSSPVLPSHTEYKFRVKKHKPTTVSLEYDRFAQTPRRIKTPEEREDDLVKGLFIARLAADIIIMVGHLNR